MSTANRVVTKNKIFVKYANTNLTKSAIKEIFNGLDLAMDSVIPGVFNGKWGGNGPIIDAKDPSSDIIISRIQTVI